MGVVQILKLVWNMRKKISKPQKFAILSVYQECLAGMYANKDEPHNILQQKCCDALEACLQLHGVVPLVVIHWASWMCDGVLTPPQEGIAADVLHCRDSCTRIYLILKGFGCQASISLPCHAVQVEFCLF